MDTVRLDERARAWRLLIGLTFLSVAAQLVAIPIGRPPGFDESIYLSQVTPDAHAMVFAAWRARGITVLIAPVTFMGGSVTAVRVSLLIVSAIATAVTFRLWIPLIGSAAPAAAATFCFTWLALLNGTEVMPNLWAAILGLATVGLVVRRVEGGSFRGTVFASITLGAMGLIRPLDATFLATAIALWVVAFRRTWWRTLAGLGVGLASGWLVWLAEMWIRYGGPIGAFDASAVALEVQARPSLLTNVATQISATDGRPTDPGWPLAGVAWWAVLVGLVVVSIFLAETPVQRAVSFLAGACGLAIILEYLVFVGGTAPRFLLPAYALASIPTGIGLTTLLRPPSAGTAGIAARRLVGVSLVAMLIPWAVWQGSVARRFELGRMRSTVAFESIGRALRMRAGGEVCRFVSPAGWPTIQFVSGCDGSELPSSHGPTEAALAQLRSDTDRVFVILRRRVPRSSPLGTRDPIPVPGPGTTWFLYPLFTADR